MIYFGSQLNIETALVALQIKTKLESKQEAAVC